MTDHTAPNKLLGQHFLKCGWVVDLLINSADIKKTDIVLEVGPGTGALTKTLAQHAGKVIAVEKDKKLTADLEEILGKEKIANVETISGDILKLLISGQAVTGNYKVVANIPYYLTSRLFRLLLESSHRPELIVMTIQKEVAERIVAKPGQMNILAASVQIFGDPQIIKAVPRACFSPVPKVDSAIIKVGSISDKKLQKEGVSPVVFFKTLKAVFSSRRKTILNNLARDLGREKASLVIAKAGIDPVSRPQELSIQNLLLLAKLA